MVNISKSTDLPWLVTGDFNEVSYAHEKSGGRTTSISRLRFFQNYIEKCGLIDLGFHGPSFTWTNKRVSGANIKERIDRVLANQQWIDLFPDNAVFHLPQTHSDHHLILTNCHGLHKPGGTKPFRFEAAWFHHPECETLLKNIWDNNSDILVAISKVPSVLLPWNKLKFENIFRKSKHIS